MDFALLLEAELQNSIQLNQALLSAQSHPTAADFEPLKPKDEADDRLSTNESKPSSCEVQVQSSILVPS